MRRNVFFLLHYRPQKCINDYPRYYIDGLEQPRKNHASDLGVIISDNFKFHDQILHACKKANEKIRIIRITFTSRTLVYLVNMFKMHVRPQVEY